MENTVSRIKQYIDYKGVSVRRFEESVGFSNGSFASQFKNNKTIGVDKVENILHIYPDINPDWLLTGRGEMCRTGETISETSETNAPTLTPMEERLLALIKEKDAKIEEQARLIGRLEAESEISNKKSDNSMDAGDATCVAAVG